MLLTGKKWQVSISDEFGDAEAILKVLLKNRGITSENDVNEFLSDNPGVWHDPFLFKDMHKAVDLISDAIDSNQKVLIYGDYDCDGVTATSILVRYFRSHKTQVDYIVPHRSEHGYGLTDNILDKVFELKPDLLITVDCGITNIDTVDIVKSKGIKVIVTDHHNVQDVLPNADAVICAKRADNTYPFNDLCGAGVAMKLVEALGRDGRHKVSSVVWRQAIELSGIATIADLVSVVDENRTLVKKAFQSMRDPQNTGVGVMNKMLLEYGKTLDESFISFNFVPRINAAGRLYDSSDALKLFLSNNPQEAKEAANDLTSQNDERKAIEAKVFEEAVMQVESSNRPDEWSLTNTVGPVVVYGSDWHQGVLGIVAGKLSQYFRRSAIVFTNDSIDLENAKGSGRAYGDFDLFGVLGGISDKLVNFGGHKKAAGMVIKKTEMGIFMRALEEASREYMNTHEEVIGNAEEILEVDAEIPFDMVNFDTYKKVCLLKPFGIGNSRPVFVTRNLIVSDLKPMSDGVHMRMELIDAAANGDKKNSLSAVGFGMGEYLNVLRVGDKIDIAYTMNEFTFRGETTISLHLEDIRPIYNGGFAWQKPEVPEKLYQSGLPLAQIAKMAPGENLLSSLVPDAQHYTDFYQILSKYSGAKTSTADCDLLAKMINNNTDSNMTPFQVKRALEVFSEAGLIKLKSLSSLRVVFSIIPVAAKVKLRDTDTYKRLNSDG